MAKYQIPMDKFNPRPLDELGIERTLDRDTNRLLYRLQTSRFNEVYGDAKRPDEVPVFIENVIDSIIVDNATADQENKMSVFNLDITDLETEEGQKYLTDLVNSSARLRKVSAEQLREESKLMGFAVGAGTLGVFAAALVTAGAGYYFGSEFSTQVANYLNEVSHLLAPVAGATQLIGSLGGAFLGFYVPLSPWITSSENYFPFEKLAKRITEKRNIKKKPHAGKEPMYHFFDCVLREYAESKGFEIETL